MRFSGVKTHRYPKLTKRGGVTKLFVREGSMLANNTRNGWFLSQKDEIVLFEEAIHLLDEEIDRWILKGRVIKHTNSVFNDPTILDSRDMNILEGWMSASESVVEIDLHNLKCKFAAIPTARENTMIFIPLLHTL